MIKNEVNKIKEEWLNKAKDIKTPIDDVIAILNVFGDNSPFIESIKGSSAYDAFLEEREFDRYKTIELDTIIDWCYDWLYEEHSDNYIECEHETDIIVRHFAKIGIKSFTYDW
ncbi:MAG: hypothetical protein ACRDD8_16360 [Bacteroidales bacterium]